MIKLTELLHFVNEENKDGLINVDDWRWPDVEHLVAMGFEFADDHHMVTSKPKIIIYKKKDKDEHGKPQNFFFIEEPDKETKRFKTFNDVIDFFDSYPQPMLDKYN